MIFLQLSAGVKTLKNFILYVISVNLPENLCQKFCVYFKNLQGFSAKLFLFDFSLPPCYYLDTVIGDFFTVARTSVRIGYKRTEVRVTIAILNFL